MREIQTAKDLEPQTPPPLDEKTLVRIHGERAEDYINYYVGEGYMLTLLKIVAQQGSRYWTPFKIHYILYVNGKYNSGQGWLDYNPGVNL